MGLVDAVDHPVDEADRVEALRVGRQIGVPSDRVAVIDTGLSHAILGDCAWYRSAVEDHDLDVAANIELAVTV